MMANTKTVHRVDGIGKQVPPNDEPFDPRLFERAIHGLQDIVIKTRHLDHHRDMNDGSMNSSGYEPGHEYVSESGTSKEIVVKPDTMLHDVISTIPPEWSVSVLVDEQRDNSFIVRASADCGGGIRVFADFYVSAGVFSRYTVGHTNIANPDETVESSDLTRHTATAVTAQLIRALEWSVMQGYAAVIRDSAPAFDYIATRDDLPANTNHQHWKGFGDFTQADWARIRDKTQQTVSNNVRSAHETLTTDLPLNESFDGDALGDGYPPALEEIDNKEKADLVLI